MRKFPKIARWFCIARDPTKPPAPGWRYDCGDEELRVFGRLPEAFTHGATWAIRSNR